MLYKALYGIIGYYLSNSLKLVNRRLAFNASLLTASYGQKQNITSSSTNVHIFASLQHVHIYR